VGVGAVALSSALVGGLLAGAIVAALSNGEPASGKAASGTTQVITVEQTSAIAEAAAKARPSVVRITSTKRSGQTTEQDVGSGVVLDTEGHILTNAHVVLNTDSLKVTFADGSERPAVMVGHDFPFTDIAVIQVGLGRLTPLPPGDSSRLRLGEAVLAIGNPLAEFDGSVSVGVVSGLGRIRTFDGVRQDDLIQTDAAVNSGNSGGALLNVEGQFVGMPTAVLRQSRSGTTVEGIAFALPSNRALDIAAGIIAAGGQYPRPSLQADHVDLTPETTLRGARPAVRQGAIITAVTSGGAADDAGIQVGDVLTKVGDYVVDEEHPLFNGLMPYQAGDTAKVVLNRNGRIIEAEVRFAKRS
jgi:2-alkenal reductase